VLTRTRVFREAGSNCRNFRPVFRLSAPHCSSVFAPAAMESILEQQRRYHEERERLMDAMVKEMLHKKMGNREIINSDHRLKMLLDVS
jgi:hypothetical protein